MAKIAELKTKASEASVADFINSIEDEQKRNDSFMIARLMEQVTKEKPRMWGTSIIGFGSYHYKYETGREGDTLAVGFSPRKQNITLYVTGYLEKYKGLLQKLGKYSAGKGCLYIKRLSDVNADVLQELIAESYKSAQNG